MAKRTVDELDGKRKREEARDEARRELDAVMAKFRRWSWRVRSPVRRRRRCWTAGCGRRATRRRMSASRSATAPAGCGGCSTTGSRSPNASWTTTRRRHLWAAVRARHGPGDLAAAWAKRLCAALKAGRVDDVLAELRQRRRPARVRAGRGLRRRAPRPDALRRLSPPRAAHRSGRVEAACKTVVGRRMKRTGMRWTVAGANPVLWLRCARLAGWFDDYWNDRLAA